MSDHVRSIGPRLDAEGTICLEGKPLGLDLLIASTALIHVLTLVTHSVPDLADISGLHIVAWLAP